MASSVAKVTITVLEPRRGRRWWFVDTGERYGLIVECIIGEHHAGYYCMACREWDCPHVAAVVAAERGVISA